MLEAISMFVDQKQQHPKAHRSTTPPRHIFPNDSFLFLDKMKAAMEWSDGCHFCQDGDDRALRGWAGRNKRGWLGGIVGRCLL
jgi:hypothetical protein